jgi:HK97 family phage major capsid protein
MSNRLKELYDAQGRAHEEAKKISDKYSGSDVYTPEDEEAWDKFNADFDGLQRQIDREELTLKREKDRRAAQEAAILDEKKGDTRDQKGDQYKRAFDHYIRTKGSEISFADLQARAATAPQNITTSADGGYLVPDQYWRQLQAPLLEEGFMRSEAKLIQTASGTLTIPKVASHGAAQWGTESGTKTETKDQFETATMSAHKAYRVMTATEEMLNDGFFDLASYIFTELGRSIGQLIETSYVVGTNSGQPNGIFTAATTGVTAASATAITSDELIDLEHSITPAYRRNAKFVMKDATLKLVRKLKDGNQNYIWQRSLESGTPSTLLGYPVRISADAPAATTGLDPILFGDIRRAYWIADRVGLSLQRLDELYALSGEVGFIGTLRTDGEMIDTLAAKVLTMA